MLTKTFAEMMAIDVSEYCEKRKGKDERGKEIEIPYLNWAKCKQLLHENGAEKVYFEPLYNEHGHSLFMSEVPFMDKNEKTNRCYEVRVKVVVDQNEWVMNYPVLNGNLVVRDDTINQLRVSNAQARAFVKCVAIHTGLGFSLWLKDSDTDINAAEDLSYHNILAIKRRIEEKLTDLLASGMELRTIVKSIGLTEKQYEAVMKCFETIYKFEKAIDQL